MTLVIRLRTRGEIERGVYHMVNGIIVGVEHCCNDITERMVKGGTNWR